MNSVLVVAALLFSLTLQAAPARPAPPATHEITVSLFNQPCLLAGPLEKSALKNIHAISPEQIYPDLTTETTEMTPEQIKKSLEKLRSSPETPPALDRYRERMTQRLSAQLAFWEGWEAAQKAKNADPLLASISKFKKGKRTRDFDALLKKTNFKNQADADQGSRLMDLLLEAVEPDPEEDFHKAIKRLNVEYTCVFAEEISTDEDGTDEDKRP